MKVKKIGTYIGSIGALLALILVAVFLPQIFFSVQDSYQTGKTDVMNRDVFDILAIQTSYPLDVNTRLSSLAEMGLGDIKVSIVEKSIDIEEFYNIKDNIRNQEYVTNLVELLPYTFGDSLELLSADNLKICNRYIVYGEDYTDGVVLMFWYMKIYLPSVNSYMELVLDSETYTIYYMSMEAQADISFAQQYDVKETSSEIYISDAMRAELEYAGLLETEQKISADIYQAASMFPDYLEIYYRSYYGIYLPPENAFSSLVISEDAVTLVCPLPYSRESFYISSPDSKSLFFRAYVEKGYGEGVNLSIGIPIIRQLVIE